MGFFSQLKLALIVQHYWPLLNHVFVDGRITIDEFKLLVRFYAGESREEAIPRERKALAGWSSAGSASAADYEVWGDISRPAQIQCELAFFLSCS